jgi:hypothetical protein
MTTANRDWFSKLPSGDEQQLIAMIKRYGFARTLAAIIRNMPKGGGRGPSQGELPL